MLPRLSLGKSQLGREQQGRARSREDDSEWPGIQTIKNALELETGEILNPDPVLRLVGERNESKIIIEGKQTRALIDSGAQLSLITTTYAKHLGLPIKELRSSFRVEGAGGIDVPYKGFVEAQISIPEIRGFDEPCLLLVSGDSEFGHFCPVILGTLHIDMILEKATKRRTPGTSVSRGDEGDWEIGS